MKRIALVIGIVIGIAATPAVVAADTNREPHSQRFELSRDWGTPLGPAYGPVQVAPSQYGFYSK